MIALVKTHSGPGNVKLKEVNEPTPGFGQVKIAVKYCGICGTDLKIKKGLAPSNPPVILGHEFCGEVHEIGEGVKNIKEGDRVVSETMAYSCGSCKYCQTGNYMMCDNRLSAGYGVDGGFAEFCVIREGALHKLPDNVSFELGALAEPLAVCVHFVIELSKLKLGEFVLVSGTGTIGLLAAFVAKKAGAHVILAGMSCDAKRLKIGKEMGIDEVVNVEEENLLSVVKEITAGYGVDKAFECAGAVASVQNCIQSLRKCGVLTQVGLVEKLVPTDFNQISRKQLKIIGSFAHNWANWETSIHLLKNFGDIISKIISDKRPLEDWREAFKEMENRKAIKILLYPH